MITLDDLLKDPKTAPFFEALIQEAQRRQPEIQARILRDSKTPREERLKIFDQSSRRRQDLIQKEPGEPPKSQQF